MPKLDMSRAVAEAPRFVFTLFDMQVGTAGTWTPKIVNVFTQTILFSKTMVLHAG